jgi:hypothetical protein
MAVEALILAIVTASLGALMLPGRFRGYEVPLNPVAAHAAVAIAGISFWWLYAGDEEQRGRSIGAIVGAVTLLVAASLGLVVFSALRGAFGSERRPARSAFSKALVLLHGAGALATLGLVAMELPDAWQRYSGNAPTVEPKPDVSAAVLLPAWIGAGLLVSLVAHILLRTRSTSSSLGPVADGLIGVAAGVIGGFLGYYAATLSAPITILAAGLAAMFVWWWRVITLAGVAAEEGPPG